MNIGLGAEGPGIIGAVFENVIQAPQAVFQSSQLHEGECRLDANLGVGGIVVNLLVQLFQRPFEFLLLPLGFREVQRNVKMIGFFP